VQHRKVSVKVATSWWKKITCRVNRLSRKFHIHDTIYRRRKINLVIHRPFVPSRLIYFYRRHLSHTFPTILAFPLSSVQTNAMTFSDTIATHTVAWPNGGPPCNFICRDSIAEFIRSTGGNTSWKPIKPCIMQMVLRVSRASTFGEPLNRPEREETRYFLHLFCRNNCLISRQLWRI